MGKMRQVSCSSSASASTNIRNYNFSRIFYHFLSWNLICCYLFHTVSSDPDSHYPFPSAHVELYSFDRGTLKIIQDKVNVPVTLSQPTRYFELYMFQCNGSYPVQWTYIGEGNPITTADAGRSFRDFYDIKTYQYQSMLLMYKLDEFQSGRYICRGMLPEHEKISIYYDVFVPVDGKYILLTNAEKTVYVPEDKETAYIPCGVSDSTAEVSLYKGNPEIKGTFKRVEENAAITFNPRKGFKVKMRELKEPYGNYMCTAKSNSRRRKVNLYPQGFKVYNEPYDPFNEKYPIQFSYDYKYNRMLCCTGTSYVPRLQWAGCTSILDCQIKSVCFDEDRCEPRIGNAGYDPSKWIDPGPLPTGCAGWKLRDDPNGDMGMFKCTTPGITQYQPYLLNRGNIFLDFETAPPAESIMTLRKISKGPVYVGRQVEFHCNGTRFYFGYGFRWAFQRGNGDIEFVEDADVIRDRFFTTAHRRQTVIKIPHADIKSIICFGPIVNHPTEWRTSSMPIQIEEEPIFVPLKPSGPQIYEDIEIHDHDPHGHRPHEHDSHQHDPHHHDPHQHDPHEHDPHQHDPHQHDPHQHDPNQHDSHQNDPHKNNPHQHDSRQNDPHKNNAHENDEPHRHEPQPAPPPYYDISPYHDSSTHLHKDENLESSLPELSYDPHLIDYSRTPGSFTNAQVLADKIKEHPGSDVYHHKDHEHQENEKHKNVPNIIPIEHYKPESEIILYDNDHPHIPKHTNPRIPDIIYDHDFKSDHESPKGGKHELPDIIYDIPEYNSPQVVKHGPDIIHNIPEHHEKDREMHASDVYNRRPQIQSGEKYGKTPAKSESVDLQKPLYSKTTYPGSGESYYKFQIPDYPKHQKAYPESQSNPSINKFNPNQFKTPVNLFKPESGFSSNGQYYIPAKQEVKSLNVNPLTSTNTNTQSRNPHTQVNQHSQTHSKNVSPDIISDYTLYKQFPSKVPSKEIPLTASADQYNKDHYSVNVYSTIPGVSVNKLEYTKPKSPSSVDPYGTTGASLNHYDHKFNPVKEPHHNHVKVYKAHPTSATHYAKGISSPVPYLNTELFTQNGEKSEGKTGGASAAIRAHFSEYYNKLSAAPTPFSHSTLINTNYQYQGEESKLSTSKENNAKKIDSILKGHFPNYYPQLVHPNPTPVRTDTGKSLTTQVNSKPLVYSTLVKTNTDPDPGKSQATASFSTTAKDNVPSYNQIKQSIAHNQEFSQNGKTYIKNIAGSTTVGGNPITFDVDFVYPVKQNTPSPSLRAINFNQSPSKILINRNGRLSQLIAQKIISGSSEIFNQRPRPRLVDKVIETDDAFVLPELSIIV